MALPPFDAAAKERAKRVAVSAGKPKTRDEGLLAIHALLNRAQFSSERAAWEAFGVSRQRFYEWRPICNGMMDAYLTTPPAAPPPPPQATSPPPQPWSYDDIPKEADLYFETSNISYPLSAELLASRKAYDDWIASLPHPTRPKDQRLLVSRDWMAKNVPNLLVHVEGDNEGLPRWAEAEHLPCTVGSGPACVTVFQPGELSPNLTHYNRNALMGPMISPTSGCEFYPDWALEYDYPPLGTVSSEEKKSDDKNRDQEVRMLRYFDKEAARCRGIDVRETAHEKHRAAKCQRTAISRSQPSVL